MVCTLRTYQYLLSNALSILVSILVNMFPCRHVAIEHTTCYLVTWMTCGSLIYIMTASFVPIRLGSDFVSWLDTCCSKVALVLDLDCASFEMKHDLVLDLDWKGVDTNAESKA